MSAVGQKQVCSAKWHAALGQKRTSVTSSSGAKAVENLGPFHIGHHYVRPVRCLLGLRALTPHGLIWARDRLFRLSSSISQSTVRCLRCALDFLA